jgi:hypothetical protein
MVARRAGKGRLLMKITVVGGKRAPAVLSMDSLVTHD